MKNSKSNSNIFRLILLLSVFILSGREVLAETRYVSDQLSIPMRSGSTNKHRIIDFPKSGTPLDVKETSDDGTYVRVTAPDGEEGWVEQQYLMSQPSARDRIVIIDNKLEKSRAQVKELKQQVAELESRNKELNTQLKQSQREMQSLESSMDNLKRVSANPLALANENKTLEAKLSKLTASNTLLIEENEQLADASTKEWFMLGAAVSLGSLLFGLIITRINWRRKRNSWGDF